MNPQDQQNEATRERISGGEMGPEPTLHRPFSKSDDDAPATPPAIPAAKKEGRIRGMIKRNSAATVTYKSVDLVGGLVQCVGTAVVVTGGIIVAAGMKVSTFADNGIERAEDRLAHRQEHRAQRRQKRAERKAVKAAEKLAAKQQAAAMAEAARVQADAELAATAQAPVPA